MTGFKEIKKNFGFGCMRLPMKNGGVDHKEFGEMVDAFLQGGFNYFDTAHTYINGMSETAIRECLVKRYPREQYILTNKLTTHCFQTEQEIRPLFERQLSACGVDYFDFYLMHAQNAEFYKKYTGCRAYEIACELKAEGKVRHVGISFHDKAAVLDNILSGRPEIEIVQIQLNYVDYDDEGIEGRRCLEVCRKHGKPVITMEPVKGGILANLPAGAKSILSGLNGGSDASYAIRYAASFDDVIMTLSGMSNMQQLKDNLSFMKDFKPLTIGELAAIDKVKEIFRAQGLIPCTACRYCTDDCPEKISIPDMFSCMNAKKVFNDWNSDWYYMVYTQNAGKAGDCTQCGKCERACPQRLKIRELLKDVSVVFDNKEMIGD